MRITTWNVNSVRARLPRVLDWVRNHEPDLLCLQEIKTVDETFPREEFAELGYAVESYGQKTYNGVALLSRATLEDTARGIPGEEPEGEARVIAATVDGVRVVNAYVPNGKAVGTDKYDDKLRWLDRFHEGLSAALGKHPKLVVCGDFNIAPEDRDVYDPEAWRGQVLFSEPEKEKLQALVDLGLADALRLTTGDSGLYTWWDYRMNSFRRNRGLRIDHFLVSAPVADAVKEVAIDREERAGEKPSDHAPVTLVLD